MVCTVVPVENKDFPGLYSFMYDTWVATYGDIITLEHIEYLLHQYFDEDQIAGYVAKGYCYYFIMADECRVGLLVYVDRGEDIFLDKLYVLSAFRKQGLAKQAVRMVQNLGKDIVLHVNRNYMTAIHDYQSMGFWIEDKVETVWEKEMVNVDYAMRYSQMKRTK
ncbi:MAG: GNAT family N-acetyltransferase [Lachnospiraceae bacterium]|nr:GNAT family N-acetyltransferase [Lachnospiraceae bacterium]